MTERESVLLSHGPTTFAGCLDELEAA